MSITAIGMDVCVLKICKNQLHWSTRKLIYYKVLGNTLTSYVLLLKIDNTILFPRDTPFCIGLYPLLEMSQPHASATLIAVRGSSPV